MGAIQSSMNQITGSVAGALAIRKHFGDQEEIKKGISELGREKAGGTDFQQLESARAFKASNEALVSELSKKRSGLLRSRRMLEKLGRWGDVQENRLANLEQEIKRYSSADAEVGLFLDNEVDKLAKGTSTILEEGR